MIKNIEGQVQQNQYYTYVIQCEENGRCFKTSEPLLVIDKQFIQNVFQPSDVEQLPNEILSILNSQNGLILTKQSLTSNILYQEIDKSSFNRLGINQQITLNDTFRLIINKQYKFVVKEIQKYRVLRKQSNISKKYNGQPIKTSIVYDTKQNENSENEDNLVACKRLKKNKARTLLDSDGEENKFENKQHQTVKKINQSLFDMKSNFQNLLKNRRSKLVIFDEDLDQQQLEQINKSENEVKIEENTLKRLKKLLSDKRGNINQDEDNVEIEEDNRYQCTICLTECVLDYGRLWCEHYFCYQCIKDWSEITTNCPLCRRQYKSVYKMNQYGKIVKKIKVSNYNIETEEEIDINIDEGCYVCDTEENQDELLICDQCDIHCCHTYCCDPPLEEIPEDKWYCIYCIDSMRGYQTQQTQKTKLADTLRLYNKDRQNKVIRLSQADIRRKRMERQSKIGEDTGFQSQSESENSLSDFIVEDYNDNIYSVIENNMELFEELTKK